MSITVGIKGNARSGSDLCYSAKNIGSGDVEVFATPSMVTLMEKAAWTSIAPHLSPEESSVGIALEISHVSATPMGMEVWADSQVTAVEGKTITFSLVAYDQAGVIGTGTHKRVVIKVDPFLQRAESKKHG